ncbi:MAG: hypothetical protein K8I82_25410, partial [Anaerolineae bacterium]|nr:hypothetical protein [Anaerolineae bacterium]
DSSQNIYVLDEGNHRVLKFSPSGQSEILTAALVAPQHLTVASIDGHERLLVLDFPPRVLVFGLDGSPDTERTDAWAALLPAEIQPVGIAFIDGILYIGDKNTGRILTFDHEGGFVGVVRGYQGTIAGLSIDHKGQRLIHGGGAIVRVTPGAAYVERGSFLAGPFTLNHESTRWHQLRIEAETLPPAAHFQFYTLTSMNNTTPAFPTMGSMSGDISTYDEWRAAPVDSPDMLLLHVPALYFWVAGSLQGDGTGSPTLRQMRLTFDHEGWIQNLPAIYQEKRSESPTLERILGLFESVMSDAEQFITDMALLLDPLTAELPWLEWLAGWLDFELDETWSENQRRQALSEAFRLYSQRGTPHGLERLLELYSGVTARIEEPTRYASIWALGETSTLGFTTMLAAANVQGAVVGTSAMLTGSHLITEEEYGVPLFEDIAHDFCVLIYGQRDLTRVHQILEHEKPAHTRYHLCVIDAALRVGQQARIGIDTIIGGQPKTLPLDGQTALGFESALPPEAHKRGRGMKLT